MGPARKGGTSRRLLELQVFKRYRVTRKREIVDAISKALALGGAKILSAPKPNTAPFQYKVRFGSGEILELICYAFLANKYKQGGRPQDEHRFQVKYGSDFDSEHEIYISPDRRVVTLFLGVHLGQQVFVGADPWMHNPTWFSSSVEFKTHHVNAAKTQGWHGWERDRAPGRRRAGHDTENYQTETLVAFTPDKFVRYVQFERLATGMDAGERLLLADRFADHDTISTTSHLLERQFQMTAQEVLDLISERFRLAVAVRGAVAEHHLGMLLRSTAQIREVRTIDEDGKPDFHVIYRSQPVLIECKNVLRKLRGDGKPRIDFQKTRASKSNPCSRFYERDAFDVLAACLHPVSEKWDFRFTLIRDLDSHSTCKNHLSQNVTVVGSNWTQDICRLLDRYCGK